MRGGLLPPPPPPKKRLCGPRPPPPPCVKASAMLADDLKWYYLDYQGKEFGPFLTGQMKFWYNKGCFPHYEELKVRLSSGDHHVPVKKLYPDTENVFEGLPHGLRLEEKKAPDNKGAESSQSSQTQVKMEVKKEAPVKMEVKREADHNEAITGPPTPSQDSHYSEEVAQEKEALAKAYSTRFGWPCSAAGGRAVKAIINDVVSNEDESSDGCEDESPWMLLVRRRVVALLEALDTS